MAGKVWRHRFSDAKRLRQLEEQNARLKKAESFNDRLRDEYLNQNVCNRGRDPTHP